MASHSAHLHQSPCGDNAGCVDTSSGSFTCECGFGFTLDSTSLQCVPALIPTLDCQASSDVMTCACAGFFEPHAGACVVLSDGLSEICGINACGLHGTCAPGDVPGSVAYTCTCAAGYIATTDPANPCVDMCATGTWNDKGVCASLSEPLPIAIGGDLWQSVQTTDQRSCGVKRDGTLWCWGTSASGDDSVPTQLGADDDWVTLTETHAATFCALKNDSTLWCWGDNSGYTIANAAGTMVALPAKIDIAAYANAALSQTNACGVRTDGTLWCWGAQPFGVASDVSFQAGVPFAVDSIDSDWTQVSLAGTSACGLRASALYCWGDNTAGQLGQGTAGGNSAVPIAVSSASDWLQTQVAGAYACGVRDDSGNGTAWCWGNTSATPTPMQGDHWGQLSVASPGSFAPLCGIRSDTHTLWCWSSLTASTTPTQLGTFTDWSSVSIAPEHACALRADGSLWCWGDGARGQLGDGRRAD